MATATVTKQQVGRIVQIIGPVVDVEFEAGHLPEIYHALHIYSDSKETGSAGECGNVPFKLVMSPTSASVKPAACNSRNA